MSCFGYVTAQSAFLHRNLPIAVSLSGKLFLLLDYILQPLRLSMILVRPYVPISIPIFPTLPQQRNAEEGARRAF